MHKPNISHRGGAEQPSDMHFAERWCGGMIMNTVVGGGNPEYVTLRVMDEVKWAWTGEDGAHFMPGGQGATYRDYKVLKDSVVFVSLIDVSTTGDFEYLTNVDEGYVYAVHSDGELWSTAPV